jgi:hypothetical protein
MRKLIDKLLVLLGHHQTWHVAWVARVPDHTDTYGDSAITVTPRLGDNTLNEVRSFLAQETTKALGRAVAPQQIHISSLTRIGK